MCRGDECRGGEQYGPARFVFIRIDGLKVPLFVHRLTPTFSSFLRGKVWGLVIGLL